MKTMLAVLFLASCATTQSANPYAYEEQQSCPARMSDDEAASGIIRCRALCSSYGRDMEGYSRDCRCFCKGAKATSNKPPVYQNQM